MSYTGNTLSRIAQTIEGTQGEFVYVTTDASTVFTTAGYVSDASIRGLKAGDTVWVINPSTGQSVQCYATFSGAVATLVSNAPPSFGANFRNVLDGGDFTANPFQRNIPGLASGGILSTAITNTAGYFADRWFAVSGSASGSVLMAAVADTSIAGFSQALQVYRSSANTNTALITLGQVVESLDVIKLQGQTVTFSFYAKALATFSALNSTVNVQIVTGTGTTSNQTVANYLAGSWTGQANTLSTTQALTTTYGRYQFTATVPTTATQLAVIISWNPVGTAGATDGIQVQGLQLEIGAVASLFEHRDVQVELEICQRYAWVIAEPANAVLVGSGTTLGANVQNFYLAAPVQFRAAPTVTLSSGSFKVAVAAAYAAATTLAAGATHTVNAISLTSANTASAGVGALLGGGGGSGWILASADF